MHMKMDEELHLLVIYAETHEGGEEYEAGCVVIEVTSGLTQGHEDGSLLTGVNHHGNVSCTSDLLRSGLRSQRVKGQIETGRILTGTKEKVKSSRVERFHCPPVSMCLFNKQN